MLISFLLSVSLFTCFTYMLLHIAWISMESPFSFSVMFISGVSNSLVQSPKDSGRLLSILSTKLTATLCAASVVEFLTI